MARGIWEMLTGWFSPKPEPEPTYQGRCEPVEVEELTPAIKVETYEIAWSIKVSDEFLYRVLKICDHFGWPRRYADWLMACMAFETDGTFDPSIKNYGGSGATGLIQFMPKTANGLGTTVERLAMMEAEHQLGYVELYFRPYAKRIKTMSDMYMAILMPKYVGKPQDTVIFQKGDRYYRQNSGLDANADNVVTKAETCAKVMAKLREGRKDTNVRRYFEEREIV